MLRRFVLLSALALCACKSEAPSDDGKIVRAYFDSLLPLAAAFEDSAGVGCDRKRARELSGEGFYALDLDVLRGLASGEKVESRLELSPLPFALVPVGQMRLAQLAVVARAVPTLSARKMLVLYRVDSLTLPEVPVAPSKTKEFTPGRANISLAMVEYPSGTVVCSASIKVESSPYLLAGLTAEQAATDGKADLVKNARQAFLQQMSAMQ